MHLKALPRGKNVTIENHPCFLRERGSYELCKLQLKPALQSQQFLILRLRFLLSPRQERIESEIIQNLKTESRNQNVTGFAEWINNSAHEKLTFREAPTWRFREAVTAWNETAPTVLLEYNSRRICMWPSQMPDSFWQVYVQTWGTVATERLSVCYSRGVQEHCSVPFVHLFPALFPRREPHRDEK